jgi:demethylmenaquinone methyltransferase/2-methoxy-6-polyprenyl-1,4-benzoquinol methylase
MMATMARKGLVLGLVWGFLLSTLPSAVGMLQAELSNLAASLLAVLSISLAGAIFAGVLVFVIGMASGALQALLSGVCWWLLSPWRLSPTRHWALYRKLTGLLPSLLGSALWLHLAEQIPASINIHSEFHSMLWRMPLIYLPALLILLAFWETSGQLAFWYAQAKGRSGGASLLYADKPDLYSPDFQQALFERLQPSYRRTMLLLSACQDQRLRAELVKLMDLQAGMRVADLMSGGGEMWEHVLPKISPNGGLVAVERSPAMLRAAQERQQRERLSQVEVRQGDALQTGLPGASFDAVVCAFGATLLTPIQRMALADEIQRLLGEHGIFGIVDLCWPKEVAARLDYQFYLRRLAPLVSPALLTGPRYMRLLSGYLDHGGNGGDLEEMLRMRGLQVYRYPLLGGRAVALVGMKFRSPKH